MRGFRLLRGKMKTIYVDEVGYSSIAGPLITCATAIGPNEQKIDGIKDSKQISKKKREALYPLLKETYKHAFGSVSPERIQEVNIHWARYEAMKMAVEKLLMDGVVANKVIVDGKFEIPNLNMPQEAVIKADSLFWEVGAASILAKVKRDNMMAEFTKSEQYSHYDWEQNAGYFSPKHRTGIILHGPSDLHRRNYKYFKYCLYCRNKYLEFLREGKTAESYFQYEEEQQEKNGESFYKLWKNGTEDIWKEIKYGEKQ